MPHRDWDEIVELVTMRRNERGQLLEAMMQVRDRYNGDWVLPDLGTDTAPMTPTIVADAIDHNALRASSVMPDITAPSMSVATGTSQDRARARRGAWLYTWEQSKLNLHLRRAYRHLFGYATTAMEAVPDFDHECVRILVRDPLHCVDTETEILTKRGWLRHDELVVGDEVAGYDMDTSLARWTRCHEVFRYEVDDEIVAVERKGLSMRVTAEHRVLAHKRTARDVNRPGPIGIVMGADLDSTHYIPRAAEWEQFGEKSLGEDFAALIGWFAAEGDFGPARSRAVYMCQSATANPEHVSNINSLLDRLSGTWGESTERRRTRTYRDATYEFVEWRLSRLLSDTLRSLLPEKLLGWWVLDLPENERRALLDAFIDGDGTRKSNGLAIFQKSKQNMDVLQAVAISLGYKTTLASDARRFVLHLADNRRPVSLRARTERAQAGLMPREKYQGVVWCPNTGTGTWFARRNGTVFITGNCFPEPKAAEDLTAPLNNAYIYGKSPDWLLRYYPVQAKAAGVERRAGFSAESDLWDVVEWVDEYDVVLGILGPRMEARGSGWQATVQRPVELRRWANKAGRCTTVTPHRVTLDRVSSAVANATGLADLGARLQQIILVSLEKSIVPDTYITGSSAQPPRLVGPWKDGRSGEVNIVTDAQAIGQLRHEPSQLGFHMLDRLSDTARLNTGTAPAFTGETFGGARTGRGLDALLATAVDPRIQESQEIMADALTEMNRIVADCYKGYWGSKSYKVYAGWSNASEHTEFKPDRDFGETTENRAYYAIPGTDIVGFNVVLGQLAGIEALSLQSFRRMHPYIKDADGEETRVLVQKLRQAAEMQILMRAQDPAGGITPSDMALLIRSVLEGDELHVAMEKAQKAAQERQAAAAPPPGEGMALAPETQPGLANPGEGAEMQGPIPPVPAGLAGLDSLLGALASPVGPQA